MNIWPFEEAKKILAEYCNKKSNKGFVLFATGYGPSGLPHIGTFGEVLRTSMVRFAFQQISDIPTKLIAFSDDMDGLRTIPDNIPNANVLKEHLDKPLSSIPDPFGCCSSFANHNNKIFCKFLDKFGFHYTFQSATKSYKDGIFNNTLLAVLNNYEEIKNIILPTLSQERKKTYSPFLPICQITGRVLQVPILEWNTNNGTIVYEHEEKKYETLVINGFCKLQWKVDWAMRWHTLSVDYEMCGKDLKDSLTLSSKIIKILGGKPPSSFIYELFLDQNAQKISKSKGNGLPIEKWLKYAPIESLAYFMYQKPKTAKRLCFDIIPKNVDEYLNNIEEYQKNISKKPQSTQEELIQYPVWHIHYGNPSKKNISPISFSMILNLVNVCNTENPKIIWQFITRYKPNITPEKYPYTNKLIEHALLYYQDFIKLKKKYRIPTQKEIHALKTLQQSLEELDKYDPQTIQNTLYQIGKTHQYQKTGDWFKALYQILLGQEHGPRMGSFIALYGIKETILLIKNTINNNIQKNQSEKYL